ncbi:MAG: molybdopterin converting factor subunit 1 [Rhodospirillales bacterium]|nr:molybdopterin converting factor subunit 1 [Rhodospirillales bacterium]MDE2391314.1 molybdopterin converting factor subunit 1 [Rhodospirillales bacterium]MDE2457612.1 molybdopterin converting factor subunit 1 [Rhodospirillales bacterium]
MRVLYFAWLRERIGKSSEELAPPPEVDTPRALIAWLRTQGPGYAAAFSDEKPVRCAIDQEFQPLDAPLGAPKEVGFFPPVTGG